MEEGEKEWKAMVGEDEEVDENKREGSGRVGGSRRQKQEAREEWRGPGRGGKPWKGRVTREG